MIQNDFHCHSLFSADANVEMENFLEYAAKNGVKNLCFTEHHDIDLQLGDRCYDLDFEGYRNRLLELQKKYSNKLNLFYGVEIGIQPYLYKRLSKVVKEHPFDFVICSNHVVNGYDPYSSDYYVGKTKEEAYLTYYEVILDVVTHFDDYDVYGHLDYIIRYGHYENKAHNYSDFYDILDEILRTIIHKGKGIELNTSGYKYHLGNPHPSAEIIKRYKELGGEIISVGSDAHRPEELLGYFNLAEEVLKSAGFKYYTIFKNRDPEMILL